MTLSNWSNELKMKKKSFFADYDLGRRETWPWTSSQWTESQMWADWKASSRTETSGREETHRGNPILETHKHSTEGEI